MKQQTRRLIGTFGLAAGVLASGAAGAVPVAFTQLAGLTGGVPQGTAVYKADLSGLGVASIVSIFIGDNSSGLGGATGQFSGFDLDAIKLSTTDCADAACAAGLIGLSVFDFVAGTTFFPGTQRAPADPKLFGTGPAGNTVDDAVARLALFDGNNSVATPDGFLSMGDDGALLFNLTAATAAAGLFLYIGEVGDNGEVAAGNIRINENPKQVPVPAPLALAGIGLAGLASLRRRNR